MIQWKMYSKGYMLDQMQNYKVIILKTADENLADITNYIKTSFHSISVAKRITNKIENKLLLLTKFPYIWQEY